MGDVRRQPALLTRGRHADLIGVFFVALNAVLVALTCVCEKQIVAKKAQTPFGYCLYRNAFALPFVLVPFTVGLESPSDAATALLGGGRELALLLVASTV